MMRYAVAAEWGLTRLRSWLEPGGRFFMHIFTHRAGTYLFDAPTARTGSPSTSSPEA